MTEAPIAKKILRQDTIHGQILSDNYFWLRDKTNPEVIAYLEAENAYTEAQTAHTKDLQQQLYDEMVARLVEDDLSVPVQKGEYFYYSRTEKGKDYSIYCRKKGNLDAEEQIILDCNKLAEGKEYFRLGVYEVSPNQQILAYGIDDNGSEYYDIYFKNLETGEVLTDKILKTGGSLEWANDNKSIFYSMFDKAHRPYQLYRYTLGDDKSDLLFTEEDDRFFLYPIKTKSEAYIILYLGSKITTEFHYLDANTPQDDFKILVPRIQGIELDIAHHGDKFYFLTNENALNFKLMSAPVSSPEKENWTEVIAHDDKAYLNSVEAFKNHLVVYGRKKGYKSITVINFKTNDRYDVAFPEPVYTYWPSDNPDFNSNQIRITYSSLITPRTVYDINLDTKEFESKKVYEVRGGHDKSQYVVERIYATASDGTKIPISLAYKKGTQKNGKNPTYLYSYGSYGASTDPYFSSIRLSLLERGFVFAMAHIRGGSEMGRHWYEDGKFLKKKNTFTDFIACAEHLIKENYTSTEHLAINGGSAGGLLMGAVVNMRPDFFHVVVADVPFVDVINTMLDESIPLTVTEFEEWGNPKDITYFSYMRSYSPYDNVEAKDYPNMLITAGLNDPRVQYWEPAKWTAKLRELKTDNNTLLLKTNMGAGHGGASGRYERIKEIAFEYAFIFDKMEIGG